MHPRLLLLAAATVLVAGCATGKSAAPAVVSPALDPDEPLQIVESKFGAEHSVRKEVLLVPFGVNQNGTELVYAVLDRAAQKGAAFVGDLAIVMTFRWGGTPIECQTRVVFDGDPVLSKVATTTPAPLGPPGSQAYGTEVDTFRPKKVAFLADDKELVCKKTAVQVTRERRTQGGSHMADAQRLADPDPARVEKVTEVEQRDVCEWKQITRPAERWDYEVKLGFVPPNWAHLSDRFAEGMLVSATPACYRIEESDLDTTNIYRLVATAYYKGAVKTRLPEALPSRGMVDSERLRTVENEQECQKRIKAAGGKRLDPNEIYPQCQAERILDRSKGTW